MQYNGINREGLEEELGRDLTDAEWNEFLREVDKFVDNAAPTQEEVDDFVVRLATEYQEDK